MSFEGHAFSGSYKIWKIWTGLGIALGTIMCLALVFSFGFQAWRIGWTGLKDKWKTTPVSPSWQLKIVIPTPV